MNILPLVLAIAFILTVLTVEQMEKFKNIAIVQKEYQHFLKSSERAVFNKRQERMFRLSERSLRQLSFRYLIDTNAREKNGAIAAQYKLLIAELIKILYADAPFYKKLKESRPEFVVEMLDAIEQAAASAKAVSIKRTQDIARLNLGDEELQMAFYHMLKGSVLRSDLKEFSKEPLHVKEKCYLSLFHFININGAEKPTTAASKPRIMIQHSPREILLAIFDNNEDIVSAIIARRNELAKNKDKESEKLFREEFSPKRRSGIDDQLLDFTITAGDKSAYT